MSIEKDLLVRAKVLIECLDTSILQDQADIILSEIKELLAQPEQDNIQYLLDQVARLTAENAMLKEKGSTQKREPIEDGELEVWYSQHTWAMDKQEYMWGFRDAEKHHGIGVDDE